MHRLYASSFSVIHIHAATMTISDLSMIWVNISPLYFCFISLFFQPLLLPYGSVYCFKFKILYSRFYWSRSTKDPATLTGLSLWVFPAFTKTKVSDRINAFLAILWRKCLDGKFWQELKQICWFLKKKNFFFGLWLWVAIKTVTTNSRRKRSFHFPS